MDLSMDLLRQIVTNVLDRQSQREGELFRSNISHRSEFAQKKQFHPHLACRPLELSTEISTRTEPADSTVAKENIGNYYLPKAVGNLIVALFPGLKLRMDDELSPSIHCLKV
ncbi:hypothetical protein BaRGS_00017949 [Batillaria attramentaria]|uniref:Uncharacterized protein n=1 Tax=Batillaria attramentaria TaxID=370345 RepID=A0ABD0J9E3_9CAEN